ncbi:CHAT domain-containing protein [Streptomyces sp. NPDC096012]|uniref:CHAT domain-containing tetratricopeptide repeat protein n=1 Tax=Streptomyces sp. NPDC096012 TaxID=3155684 RepID=UPI00336A13F3
MSYGDGATPPDPTEAADAWMRRFRRTGDRGDLDQAVEWFRAALREALDERGSRECSANLRVGLWFRWDAYHDDRDRDELITLAGEAATEEAAEQDLLFLGVALRSRFDDERRAEDRDRAIDALRRAAAVPVERSHNRLMALDYLGRLLTDRFEETGDPGDLAEAERVYRRALSHTAPGHEARAAILHALAAVREHSFGLTQDPRALREGLELRRAALAESPPGVAHRAIVLDGLGTALRTWVGVSPDETAVDEMLRVTRTALTEAPGRPDAPERLQALTGLGVALRLAGEHGGGTAMLRESVDLLRAAVRHTPPAGPLRALRLNSLGNALHRLGEQTGDAALLDETVEVLREAVARSGPGQADGPVANLALALRERYHQTGDLAALREAADLARRAVESGGAAPDSTAHLANLGVVLQTWYDRTGDASAAAEAVDVARDVLARTPQDGPQWTGRANHLANALSKRHAAIGDPADREEAISLLTRAADATAYGDPKLPVLLHNLGKALLDRATAMEDPAGLDQAVTTLGRAVWARSGGEAEQANLLLTYASALRTLHEAAGDPGVLLAAEDAYRQVAAIGALPADRRIAAARDWGAAAADAGRWDEALRGYRTAVELLPFSVTRRLARGDQEHRLTRVHGLAAEAAACAVNAGEPELAVQLLEHGRGVLLWQAVSARGEWERLRAAHPEPAELFLRLRDRIDALDAKEAGEGEAGAALEGKLPADERHRLAAEWERLVTRIRALPGFADFLAAPTLGSLLACAGRGPVVLAYCSVYRSDALVLRPDGVGVVPLPEVTPATLEHQVARLDDALAAATDPVRERQAQHTLGEVLGWAWDHIAERVLARLGLLDAPSGDDWPRLWWSPGGALAALPLHAAGHHDGQRTVLDRVISSYTPTVRTLAYARARAAGPAPPGRLLAVAQPDTPGARPLGGARREVAELAKLLPFELITGSDATLARVVRALPEHPYAHFACHGVSDPDDPSNARLLVHDHQREPLTVRRISRLDLPRARLAVLSACETARGAERLADESIHITSAFQVAGYPHAIGTLWPVHDAVAVRVTRSLYGHLRDGGHADPAGLDTARSAIALHHAVRECRAAFPRTPSLWAAHVHSGP